MKTNMKISRMRKKIYIKLLSISIITILLVMGAIGYGVYWAFFDMNRLPTGELLTKETSPDGKFTFKAYVINGGATSPYSIRGELTFNEQSDKTKNVYWNYREDQAVINWVDNDTVTINGHILDMPKETFDFRREN